MDFWEAIFGEGRVANPETDPSKYARSAEITDSDTLMLLSEIVVKDEAAQRIMAQMRELQESLALLGGERQVLNVKIFRRLRELYPHVAQVENHAQPYGYRRHNETYYFVSWDAR